MAPNAAAASVLPDDRGGRVIVLVHRDELADQAIAKIRAVSPDLNVGKVKAADNDLDADVMVCSVQTLAVARRLTAGRHGPVNPRHAGRGPEPDPRPHHHR